MSDKRSFWFCARIGLILMLICGLSAGVVALVNELTYEAILENLEMEKKQAIMDIFKSDTLSYQTVDGAPEAEEDVYEVTDEGVLMGYCVNLASGGFGGDINMMVGVGTDGRIVGVTIVSLSETAGLGSRVNDSGYLSQYIGKGRNLGYKTDIDGITGATISSKAVLAGVNMATSVLNKMGLTGGGN